MIDFFKCIPMSNNKKLSFCIVCKDRLNHLQSTLRKNIVSNLRDDVEFVLLDYSSLDGMGAWVESFCHEYIARGILSYYKYQEATSFHRTHSRNMAFKLACGEYLCNLDADNYLGNDFAGYILNIFEKKQKVFITSDYSKRDSIGRVCVSKSDFLKVRGYNEKFAGYGFEDIEFYNRLQESGLKQIYSSKNEYYKAITHSHELRLKEEKLYAEPFALYLQYISPYKVAFILAYHNGSATFGRLINNYNKNFNNMLYEQLDITKREISDYRRTVLESNLDYGVWHMISDSKIYFSFNKYIYSFKKNNDSLIDEKGVFYKIMDKKLYDEFMLFLSDAINYNTYKNQYNQTINPHGFGLGKVIKNFNDSEPIFIQ